MGVFSYLNIKKPASVLWKAFSPGRETAPEDSPSSSSDSVVLVTKDSLKTLSKDSMVEDGAVRRGLCSPQADQRPLTVGRMHTANIKPAKIFGDGCYHGSMIFAQLQKHHPGIKNLFFRIKESTFCIDY